MLELAVVLACRRKRLVVSNASRPGRLSQLVEREDQHPPVRVAAVPRWGQVLFWHLWPLHQAVTALHLSCEHQVVHDLVPLAVHTRVYGVVPVRLHSLAVDAHAYVMGGRAEPHLLPLVTPHLPNAEVVALGNGVELLLEGEVGYPTLQVHVEKGARS